MKTGTMLQIKPTRKLHDSGFRILKVFIDNEEDKPLSKVCDVIDLDINGARIRIDVDRSGYIRIWSDGNKIKTEENQYSTVSVQLGINNMIDEDKQVISFGLQKDFWKKVNWVHYTTKYNERLLAFEEGGNVWNFPVADFSKGDLLAEKPTLAEWKRTDLFYQNLMERITLCLNFCKDKTNEELKG